MKGIVTLFILLVGGLASQLAGQQPTSVQSAAPAIDRTGSALPVNPDPEAGKLEIKSTTSDAIGGARPVEAAVPGAGGSVQSTAAEMELGLHGRTEGPSTTPFGPQPTDATDGKPRVPSPADAQILLDTIGTRPLTPAEIEELKDGK